jgi:hypothetical protein
LREDSIRPAKVLEEWDLQGRRRPSGFGVLDRDTGGELEGVLMALEYGEEAYLSSGAARSLSKLPKMPPRYFSGRGTYSRSCSTGVAVPDRDGSNPRIRGL